ncbi:hypothetical protein [Hyphomicrobium sulfonivorans]|uniref:hypothetical protein n=1 Tax=Hyphomicrobium sulfonivorans TaxID=121290 RepID=UPI000B1FE583|nr:hypothetical protein [Hyphomicrobium sulfonivorans]
MRTETGDKIVDWLMDIAWDNSLPLATRLNAREKIRKAALRAPSEAVEDVVGPPN